MSQPPPIRYPTFRYYYLNGDLLEGGPGGSGVASSDLNADGQLIIGSSSGDAAVGNIVAGDGITVANGPGAIEISAARSYGEGEGYYRRHMGGTNLSNIAVDAWEELIVIDKVVETGNYIVIFTGDWETSTDATLVELDFFVDGVSAPLSSVQRHTNTVLNQKQSVTYITVATLDTAQLPAIYWKVSGPPAASATFSIRRIMFARIG